MKVISIWQPFASLAVKGIKTIETRVWPAPASVIGETIGIASTKNIKPEQRAHFLDDEFQSFYQKLGMPGLEDLPLGFLLGTAVLDSVDVMTPELLDDVSDEEKAYGWWDVGNFAWRLTGAREFPRPIPIVGKQGLFEWNGTIPDAEDEVQARQGSDQGRPERQADIRRHLRIV
ncbi:MAG: hypothetical protein DI537_14635 [Stutzerimonas stutzeri]|nr:MAG: hypothetical protein DI537_14635 [Stutzerimonas stutzeri]